MTMTAENPVMLSIMWIDRNKWNYILQKNKKLDLYALRTPKY